MLFMAKTFRVFIIKLYMIIINNEAFLFKMSAGSLFKK